MAALDEWLEQQRENDDVASRERRWLLKLEQCWCTRAVPTRWYLGRVLCAKCSRWIAYLTRRRR